MRAFRIACLLISFSAFTFAQTPSQPAPAQSATQPPDPQPAAKYRVQTDDTKQSDKIDHPSTTQPSDPSNTNSLAGGAPALPADLQQIVNKQFGPNFHVALQRVHTTRYLHQDEHATTWSPLLVGDLDGDGSEDAVIVARVKNAFSGQIPFKYAVVDPYFSAFGYGNPRITAGLSSEYPDGDFVVLVIHGVGPEGWRTPVPKAKFVMINLPFNTINVAPMVVGKKKKAHQVSAIILEEDGSNQSSLVVWDGRKYRWQDMGGPGE